MEKRDLIPKRLITIWLSEEEKLPPLIEKCAKTHILPGYENVHITLDNCYRNKYVNECLDAGHKAKAADYLRIHYLQELGGIYVDMDFEFLPDKNFDTFLGDTIFCGEEENKYLSNAIIGSVAGHPLLSEYLHTVNTNFIGSGSQIFQPGMFLWTEMAKYNKDVTVYPPVYFLPFCWQNNTLKTSELTVGIHWFNRSWLPKTSAEPST